MTIRNWQKLLMVLAVALSSHLAFAVPAQVLIIRHGEKINDINPHLSARGKERAKKLVDLFLKNPKFNRFGPPVAIYAAAPKTDDSSTRPQDTVLPLAKALKLNVNLEYNKKQYDDLSDAIYNNPKYNNKTVVICWVRQTIPDLASAFYATEVPTEWSGDSFDRVWKIQFKDGENAGRVIDLPQGLFPSDSE